MNISPAQESELENLVYIDLPTLHKNQQKIKDDKHRFRVVCCGRRWGKTALAVDEIVEHALAGETVAYMAPTYKMSSKVWLELKEILSAVTKYKNEQERTIRLLDGIDGSIDFWSLDSYDSIRGREYDFIVIDEAAFVDNFSDAWGRVIRPLVSSTKGGILFISTPQGRDTFWELHLLGLSKDEPEWAYFHFTSYDNPLLDSAEVDSAKRTLTERFFREEYLAQFLTDSGLVFKNIDATCTLSHKPTYTGNFLMGIDWARDNDYTVAVVIDVDSKEMVDFIRFSQIEYYYQRKMIKALFDKWDPMLVLAEYNGIGGPNIEALEREGIEIEAIHMTAKTKPKIIQALALAMEIEEIKIIKDDDIVHELKTYGLKRTESGYYKYSAPKGGHDDCVIAIAITWWGIAEQLASGVHFSEIPTSISEWGIRS